MFNLDQNILKIALYNDPKIICLIHFALRLFTAGQICKRFLCQYSHLYLLDEMKLLPHCMNFWNEIGSSVSRPSLWAKKVNLFLAWLKSEAILKQYNLENYDTHFHSFYVLDVIIALESPLRILMRV